MDNQTTNPTPPKPSSLPLIIMLVIIITAVIVGGGMYLLLKSKSKISPDDNLLANVNTEVNQDMNQSGADENVIQQKPQAPIILYVSEGDVWQADINGENKLKLIDADKISAANFSPSRKWTAYIIPVAEKKSVTNYDGTTEMVDVVKKQLFVADSMGANSFLVKEPVERWGWLPSADILWYETASLKQIFMWQYYGDNNIWTFNPQEKKAISIIADNQSILQSILGIKWSPDSQNVIFVKNMALQVVNRFSLQMNKLLDIPYVGGDRGGPPPIPAFYWSADSQYIYTAFTPLSLSTAVQYTEKYLTVLKIYLNGQAPVKLMPDVPSGGMNEEIFPQVAFNEDFTKIVYPRLVVRSADELSDYYEGRLVLPVKLALYDTLNQTETILLDNLENLNYAPGYPRGESIYIDDEFIYFLTGIYKPHQLIIKKINYKNNEIVDITSDVINNHFAVEKIGRDLYLKGITHVYYDNINNIFYVLLNSKLFSLKENNASIILENVDWENVYLAE